MKRILSSTDLEPLDFAQAGQWCLPLRELQQRRIDISNTGLGAVTGTLESGAQFTRLMERNPAKDEIVRYAEQVSPLRQRRNDLTRAKDMPKNAEHVPRIESEIVRLQAEVDKLETAHKTKTTKRKKAELKESGLVPEQEAAFHGVMADAEKVATYRIKLAFLEVDAAEQGVLGRKLAVEMLGAGIVNGGLFAPKRPEDVNVIDLLKLDYEGQLATKAEITQALGDAVERMNGGMDALAKSGAPKRLQQEAAAYYALAVSDEPIDYAQAKMEARGISGVAGKPR